MNESDALNSGGPEETSVIKYGAGVFAFMESMGGYMHRYEAPSIAELMELMTCVKVQHAVEKAARERKSNVYPEYVQGANGDRFEVAHFDDPETH